MSLATRMARIERSRATARESLVIVVQRPEPDMDAVDQQAAAARALDHARPYLRGLGHNFIVEIEAGHIRLESPSPDPLVCWCGQVHERGYAVEG